MVDDAVSCPQFGLHPVTGPACSAAHFAEVEFFQGAPN